MPSTPQKEPATSSPPQAVPKAEAPPPAPAQPATIPVSDPDPAPEPIPDPQKLTHAERKALKDQKVNEMSKAEKQKWESEKGQRKEDRAKLRAEIAEMKKKMAELASKTPSSKPVDRADVLTHMEGGHKSPREEGGPGGDSNSGTESDYHMVKLMVDPSDVTDGGDSSSDSESEMRNALKEANFKGREFKLRRQSATEEILELVAQTTDSEVTAAVESDEAAAVAAANSEPLSQSVSPSRRRRSRGLFACFGSGEKKGKN